MHGGAHRIYRMNYNLTLAWLVSILYLTAKYEMRKQEHIWLLHRRRKWMRWNGAQRRTHMLSPIAPDRGTKARRSEFSMASILEWCTTSIVLFYVLLLTFLDISNVLHVILSFFQFHWTLQSLHDETFHEPWAAKHNVMSMFALAHNSNQIFCHLLYT